MPVYDLGEWQVQTPGPGKFWVAPTASVIGRVTLAESVNVWFGATIRGDNDTIRIGRRTSVQENVVLHVDPGFPMVIGDEVIIGHGAMLHGCTIGDRALIAMGAIVLNGAKVGEGAMIGAGALVPPGKVIPPNSVVLGSPGKVVREVTDDERAFNAWGVDDYDKRWRQYAATMRTAAG
ncbi:MAG: gamma carbonic anhydrase family protein [Hyphomicrobiaceae bacterium]|nr:gamma carbonic anhydrase family protein [Hyphomicrobiaceae bacterium]